MGGETCYLGFSGGPFNDVRVKSYITGDSLTDFHDHGLNTICMHRSGRSDSPTATYVSASYYMGTDQGADSTEYVDWLRARRARFPNLHPSTTTLSIRLPEMQVGCSQSCQTARLPRGNTCPR